MRLCWKFVLLLMLTFTLFSCGKTSSGTVTVHGHLTYDGQPVPGMQIFFQPEQGRGSSGKTGEDGAFEMYLTRNQKGVQPGVHRVTFEWTPTDESLVSKGPGSAIQGVMDHVRKHGPLKIEVKASQPDLRIELP